MTLRNSLCLCTSVYTFSFVRAACVSLIHTTRIGSHKLRYLLIVYTHLSFVLFQSFIDLLLFFDIKVIPSQTYVIANCSLCSDWMITIQIGQAGNQIGAAFWQRAIRVSDHITANPFLNNDGKARCILVDTEPKVLRSYDLQSRNACLPYSRFLTPLTVCGLQFESFRFKNERRKENRFVTLLFPLRILL